MLNRQFGHHYDRMQSAILLNLPIIQNNYSSLIYLIIQEKDTHYSLIKINANET